jgi:hypothetical protein
MKQYGYVVAAYAVTAALYGGYVFALRLRERSLLRLSRPVSRGSTGEDPEPGLPSAHGQVGDGWIR